ncbi:MAG: helix-turn-helix transcriptional regulator [Lachnospiraceae bacterium]|jgi:DNA-binding Xre family transcriptional regulator|nr:helix-turn-helix transcriptional regulator [Lachnospiraceae bacterium]
MIVFDRLWETMKEKEVTQYKLIKKYGISPAQITRLKKNENINTHTINMLCELLDCRVEDIMEYKKEDEKED